MRARTRGEERGEGGGGTSTQERRQHPPSTRTLPPCARKQTRVHPRARARARACARTPMKGHIFLSSWLIQLVLSKSGYDTHEGTSPSEALSFSCLSVGGVHSARTGTAAERAARVRARASAARTSRTAAATPSQKCGVSSVANAHHAGHSGESVNASTDGSAIAARARARRPARQVWRVRAHARAAPTAARASADPAATFDPRRPPCSSPPPTHTHDAHTCSRPAARAPRAFGGTPRAEIAPNGDGSAARRSQQNESDFAGVAKRRRFRVVTARRGAVRLSLGERAWVGDHAGTGNLLNSVQYVL